MGGALGPSHLCFTIGFGIVDHPAPAPRARVEFARRSDSGEWHGRNKTVMLSGDL